MYSGYNSIAGIYDKINEDIDYRAWADYFEKCFEKYLQNKPELVLDLACGTGSMTMELARRGYDMIGVDGSECMLSVAYSRAYGENISGILYLNQDMRQFELYGTVGAVSCCLDSINYLISEEDIGQCFKCVHNYLDPGGLFLFDVNTPYKFENIYGSNSYILECEDENGYCDFCGWQNEYDKESKLCRFYLSVFSETVGGKYTRRDEEQTERCYSLSEIADILDRCGFEFLGVFGDFEFSSPAPECERWHFVARAIKN